MNDTERKEELELEGEQLHEHQDDHEHDHDDLSLEDILPEDMEEFTITMADEETGEEFTFLMADDFELDGEVYVVLLSTEEDPEAVFAKVIDLEDGTEGFETLEDEEYDRVSDYYIELCEAEEDEEYEDDEDDEDDYEEDELED